MRSKKLNKPAEFDHGISWETINLVAEIDKGLLTLLDERTVRANSWLRLGINTASSHIGQYDTG